VPELRINAFAHLLLLLLLLLLDDAVVSGSLYALHLRRRNWRRTACASSRDMSA
jgi:hypothetical protein